MEGVRGSKRVDSFMSTLYLAFKVIELQPLEHTLQNPAAARPAHRGPQLQSLVATQA